MKNEKQIQKTAEILLVIGGLNWGLALFDINAVTFLFGDGIITSVVYGAVGLSAAWLGWNKWFRK